MLNKKPGSFTPPLHGKKLSALLLLGSFLTLILSPYRASASESDWKKTWIPRAGSSSLSWTAPSIGTGNRPWLFVSSVKVTHQITASASNGESSSALAPWTDIGSNALAAFSGRNALLHLGALAGTALIIGSGLDTQVHNFFVRNTFFEKFSHPGVAQGSIFPLLLGAGLMCSGAMGNSSRLISAGGAVLQAALLAVATSTSLKALTGRPGPEPVIYDDNQASATFRFGFLRGGVFHGWPSGHMLANTAAVTSLLSFYDNTWLDIAGGAYLGYLFMSVISHGRSSMHWFSDAVAGAVMGLAIGTTVGRDFRRHWENKKKAASSLSVGVLPQFFSVTFDIKL